jgi:ribonuclease Z
LLRTALLECTRHFPEPEIEEQSWKGPIVFENAELTVEAVPVDHTVPCLAYALVEKPGYHPDLTKLANGVLRSGSWVAGALELLRTGAPSDTMIEIQGGRFPLGTLADQYFLHSRGVRVAYVTDTYWSDTVRPGLLKLAHRAHRLYCDSYYAHAQSKQAATHRHMTATTTAEFAKLAKVDELVLIHFAPRYAGRYHALIEEARAIFPNVTADLG